MDSETNFLDKRIKNMQDSLEEKTQVMIKECDNLICKINKVKSSKSKEVIKSILSYFHLE